MAGVIRAAYSLYPILQTENVFQDASERRTLDSSIKLKKNIQRHLLPRVSVKRLSALYKKTVFLMALGIEDHMRQFVFTGPVRRKCELTGGITCP